MNIRIRPTQPSDAESLKNWFLEPGILKWFPMINLWEIEDSIRICMHYAKMGAGLTAEVNGKPCGAGNLYLQSFKKLSHQCLFAIIVEKEFRGKGIGSKLLQGLIDLAKNTFHIELLHLEVYEGNPAISLYKRYGFEIYGRHERFLKEPDGYRTKILMQKKLS